jgi:hypothetical protein
MTPDEQKQQLDETIRRKLGTTTVAASVPVASASSRRAGDASPRSGSLERGTTKSQ